jgi:hypothetical protein
MYPDKHKLKECTMMKNYMTTGTFAKVKRLEGDSAGKAVVLIYGRPAPHESRRKLKLTGRAINAVSAAVLESLC